jgi:hypothetical protein
LLGIHAKPRELQYTDFTIEKINENISNWLTNDVRASRVISTNRNEGDIYGIVSNNFASKPKKKIRYFDSYANEFNTPLTNRPMDDLYNYIITDKVSDSLNPELTDSSTQVLHSKLSIDQKGFLREYLKNIDITIVQVIILLYGLLFFVHLEFGIGSEKEFNESEVEWFFIHNQSEKDIIDEKDKLISHVESYQDLIFKQMNRFGSRYNYGRNGYLLFRFYWDDLFINYFIDIFPAHKRYLFFHKNETSRENLQNLKDILLLIYDKIDTDLPLDKYNPKRIKHFKSMFGTFEKEFASKDFILDNQYVEGRTEYISCEDFKAKLDTLYEDGFQPVSYEKCNMMGKYGTTSITNELTILSQSEALRPGKLKDFMQSEGEDEQGKFCRSSDPKINNGCITNIQTFFRRASDDQDPTNVDRTISDIYFVKMTKTNNSDEIKWVPMFSVMFHRFFEGNFPKFFENNIDENFSSSTLSSALNDDNNIIIRHFEIEPKKTIKSKGKGFLIFSSTSEPYDLSVVKISIDDLYSFSCALISTQISDNKLANLTSIIETTKNSYQLNNMQSIVLYSSPTTRDFNQVIFDNENTSLQILLISTENLIRVRKNKVDELAIYTHESKDRAGKALENINDIIYSIEEAAKAAEAAEAAANAAVVVANAAVVVAKAAKEKADDDALKAKAEEDVANAEEDAADAEEDAADAEEDAEKAVIAAANAEADTADAEEDAEKAVIAAAAAAAAAEAAAEAAATANEHLKYRNKDKNQINNLFSIAQDIREQIGGFRSIYQTASNTIADFVNTRFPTTLSEAESVAQQAEEATQRAVSAAQQAEYAFASFLQQPTTITLEATSHESVSIPNGIIYNSSFTYPGFGGNYGNFCRYGSNIGNCDSNEDFWRACTYECEGYPVVDESFDDT